MKHLIYAIIISICVPTTAQADFGDGGKWKMGPFGAMWDDNSWPEFTPMYWMEEMVNEFDNDDMDFSPFAQNQNMGQFPGQNFSMPSNANYQDWYEDDSDNDWPEWTPMYWMEEFSDAVNDDDRWNDRLNQYRRYSGSANVNAARNVNQHNAPIRGEANQNMRQRRAPQSRNAFNSMGAQVPRQAVPQRYQQQRHSGPSTGRAMAHSMGQQAQLPHQIMRRGSPSSARANQKKGGCVSR